LLRLRLHKIGRVLPALSELKKGNRALSEISEVLSGYACNEDWELLGPDEMINLWEDFVDEVRIPIYIEPVFTKQEQCNLLAFHKLWLQYCEYTPKNMPPFKEIKATLEWKNLRNEAIKLLELFELRGKLDEEIEIT
jgi:hypothetical protein